MSVRKPAIARASMGVAERRWRSRLAQIAASGGLVRGSLLERYRACGNPNCRCARGRKHRAVYLMLSDGGRLRQLFIPAAWEDQVRQWVANHKELKGLLKQISEVYWEKVRQRQG
jgi:hypothetical protein